MINIAAPVIDSEKNWAEYCGVKHALAVNSGTAAIHCALYAAGVKEGDEVITTPYSFIATINPILMLGARPVLVDIDEETFNIDVSKIEAAITEKTKAIVPVDLYGQPCDWAELQEIAKKHNLKIVEDACQAIAVEQLKKVEEFTKERQENARKLNDALAGVAGIKTPTISDNRNHVYHQYTILLNKGMQRDQFIASLRDKGVGAGIYYPKPLHIYPHIAKLGYKIGDFPVAEDLAARVVSLPVHPKVTDEDIEVIAAAVKESING